MRFTKATFFIIKHFSLISLIWLTFATFEISFDRGVIRLYRTSVVQDSENENRAGVPRQIPLGVEEVRFRGGSVQITRDFFVSAYENCSIDDLKNWICASSNGAYKFGLSGGSYFTRANTPQDILSIKKYTYVTRFRYIIVSCKRDWEGGPQRMFTCALRPFVH